MSICRAREAQLAPWRGVLDIDCVEVAFDMKVTRDDVPDVGDGHGFSTSSLRPERVWVYVDCNPDLTGVSD